MDREGRYLQMVEGSGGSEDGPRQPRRTSKSEVAAAGYRTVSMADRVEDGLMSECCDPFSDKVL